jgi:hypothetical protein
MSDVFDDFDDEYYDCPEDHSYFEGPCTCLHEPIEHGWGECNVESCECQAHWTE